MQYTFWPDRKLFQPHLLIPALSFIVAGACWGAIAFFENVPAPAALHAVSGNVETVTKIDNKGTFYSTHRYDLQVKARDGRVATAKIEQDILPRNEVQGLYNKQVMLGVSPENWIMSIKSGEKDILSYDKARQYWEDDIRFRIKFGSGVVLVGLMFGAIHIWLARRKS